MDEADILDSMFYAGIDNEICFPFKIRDDKRYYVQNGEVYEDDDIDTATVGEI